MFVIEFDVFPGYWEQRRVAFAVVCAFVLPGSCVHSYSLFSRVLSVSVLPLTHEMKHDVDLVSVHDYVMLQDEVAPVRMLRRLLRVVTVS